MGGGVVVTPELLTQLLVAGKTGSSSHLFFSGRGIGDNKELNVRVLMSEAQVCVIQFFPCAFIWRPCVVKWSRLVLMLQTRI